MSEINNHQIQRSPNRDTTPLEWIIVIENRVSELLAAIQDGGWVELVQDEIVREDNSESAENSEEYPTEIEAYMSTLRTRFLEWTLDENNASNGPEKAYIALSDTERLRLHEIVPMMGKLELGNKEGMFALYDNESFMAIFLEYAYMITVSHSKSVEWKKEYDIVTLTRNNFTLSLLDEYIMQLHIFIKKSIHSSFIQLTLSKAMAFETVQ